jgi:hypothetical protein
MPAAIIDMFSTASRVTAWIKEEPPADAGGPLLAVPCPGELSVISVLEFSQLIPAPQFAVFHEKVTTAIMLYFL